jgi:glycine oxidase
VTIVIVGAGIVGLAVAHELASRGARVRVLDPRGVAQGATRASAGMLAPYIEGHIDALLRLGLCSMELYPEFIRRVEADSGAHVEYEREGTLHVAMTDVETAHLASTARTLAAIKADCEMTDAAGARRLEPNISERAAGALLVRRHGYVAPGPLAAAVALAAQQRGATLSAMPVLGVDEAADGLSVRTPDGTVRADAVVIAAGSWSSALSPGPGTWIKPIRGQLVHLHAATRPASRVVWGAGCYIVPWRDGSALVGATVEDVGFDERATAGGVQRLLTAAIDLLPGLAAARVQEVRVGLRPMIADELPAIGSSSTRRRLFYATGHYRSGVLLAPLTALLVADLVLDGRERPELSLVRPARLGL